MLSVRPTQGVGELVYVLRNRFRNPQRIAELLIAADVDLGQAGGIAAMVGIRDPNHISCVGAEIERQSGVLEANVPCPKVVQQSRIEDVTPISSQTLHLVIQSARGAGTGPSVDVGEVGGVRRIGGGNRIVGKKTILGRNVVVEPSLKGGFIKLIFSVENEIIRETRAGNIRKRK